VAHPSQSHREGWVIRATREPFSFAPPRNRSLSHPPGTVISTEAAHSLIVGRAVEKSASLSTPLHSPQIAFVFNYD
jgi:hypothetical protein